MISLWRGLCVQVIWSGCDKVYVCRYHDQVVTGFMSAGTMISLWWGLCVQVTWSGCNKVYVCRYHDQVVTGFMRAGTMIRLWQGLCVQVPWSGCDEVYVCRYCDQVVTRFMCAGTMVRLWQGFCVQTPWLDCDEVYVCRYRDRFGVEVGKTTALIYAGTMTGRKWVTGFLGSLKGCHSFGEMICHFYGLQSLWKMNNATEIFKSVRSLTSPV